jgi:hypothetical protein
VGGRRRGDDHGVDGRIAERGVDVGREAGPRRQRPGALERGGVAVDDPADLAARLAGEDPDVVDTPVPGTDQRDADVGQNAAIAPT